MNNLKRIKNNTSNSIMINGIFLGPQTETVLTDEVVQSIDKTYFLSGILVDLGEYQIETPSIKIETSKIEKPVNNSDETTQPKRKRRRKKESKEEVNVETKTKESTIETTKIQEQEVSNKENSLSKEGFASPAFNILGSSGITEEELLLMLANYYKKPPTGIPINDFDEDVRALLERARRAALKNQISFEDLSSELQKIIKSSNPSDMDGDGKVDNSLGSGGTADIIGSQILIPIKENMLDKAVRNILSKANSAYQKPIDGIPFSDLSSSVQEKIDSVDSQNHFWKEPVSSIGLLPFLDNKDGDIRLVMETNKLYRWDEESQTWLDTLSATDTGSDSDVPTSDPQITPSILGEFFAYRNQTRFTLATPYNVGTNQLMVQLNGLLVYKDVDYIEVNNRVIEFLYPLSEDDYVVFALSSTNSSSVIITQIVEIDVRVREIKLQHAFSPGTDSLRVFLNGVQLQDGDNGDYIEVDTRTLSFNIDLLPGDVLACRVETSTISKNLSNQMALLRTIYSDLAKKVDRIQKSIL